MKVNVGANQGTPAQFILPESLARARSGVIGTAVSRIAPGSEKRISLPDIQPHHSQYYAQWLYTGRVFILEPDRVLPGRLGHRYYEMEEHARWGHHLKVATELRDIDFQDALTDAIIEWINEFREGFDRRHGEMLAFRIDRDLSPDSPARRVPIEASIKYWRTREFKDLSLVHLKGPEWFVQGLFAELVPFVGSTAVSRKSIAFPKDLSQTCDYHEHTRLGRPCYKSPLPL